MRLPNRIIAKLILVSFLLISSSFSFIFAESYSSNSALVITRSNEQSAYSVSIQSVPSNAQKKVQGAFDLVFVVTPDANGNWTYSVPQGLDPGTYTVTVKDQSGKVLETSTFTVTSTQVTTVPTSTPVVLPNTGIIDNLFLPIIIGSSVILISFYLSLKANFKKNIIK